MKNIGYTVSIVVLLISCSTPDLNKDTENENNTNPRGNPAIAFEKEVHDFGELVDGEKVAYTFKFKNTGDTDLIIKDVKAACGCTTPQWNKNPIKPEQTGKIEVVFDSSGRKGDQQKTIRVFTNAAKQESMLVITAHVNNDV
jgi:hypothetical protein